MSKIKEQTLVILKPDALQRNLLGEVISRFEKKGLKIVGMKMVAMNDVILAEHYVHHKDKPFFEGIKKYMKLAPCIVICLEGFESVKVTRDLCGPTLGRIAPPGTIRGDFSMSIQANIIHASESVEVAKQEVARFFGADELFKYKKIDADFIYAEDERK